MHSPAATTNGANLVTVTSFSTPVQSPLHQQQPTHYTATVQAAPGSYPFHHRVGPFSTSVVSPASAVVAPPQLARGRGRGAAGRASAHFHNGHYGAWDPHKLYNNMSQYNTNPVGALQERYQSRGITPNYRVVQAEGASHCPTFSYQVFVEDFIAMGSGSSKKQAKHNAARAMLDKLDGRSPAQDGIAPLPAVSGITNAPQAGAGDPVTDGGAGDSGAPVNAATGNTIGQLQELCVHRGLPMPVYDVESVGGQPHQRSFELKVNVGGISATGEGTSKKDAKRNAAAKMIKNLNVLHKQGGSPDEATKNSVGGGEPTKATFVTEAKPPLSDNAEIEDLSRRFSELLRVDKMTPEASERIQRFWQEMQTGNKLLVLQTTLLKPQQGDYKVMLADIAADQDFEVIYVTTKDRADDGQLQVLVQLCTMPVAVILGSGKDEATAQQEAARNALNYIKLMTQKTTAEVRSAANKVMNGQ